MKKITAAVLVAALTILVTGCDTVKGIGKDVSATGEAIDTAATAVQKQM